MEDEKDPKLDVEADEDDDAWRDKIGREDITGPTERPRIRLATGRDTRADILLGPDVHRTCEAMVNALVADADLYYRSHTLVHVVPAEAKDENFAPGSPLIRPCPASYVGNRISMHARCLQKRTAEKGADRWVHVPPPTAQVRAVHEQGHWPGAREIVGVIESPTMRPDGTIVQTPGYDAATRYLYAPNAIYPVIAESPTQQDAKDALARLSDLFVDFPFVDDAARMVPIAAILSLVGRPAINGAVPGFGFDSPTRGTGKGLAGAIPAAIATGRPPPLCTFPAHRNGSEEVEKILGSHAINGAPLVFFDNQPIGWPFGGQSVEKYITAPDRVSVRILGKLKERDYPWRAVIFVTGNNLAIAEETARRMLVARMVATEERPEERTNWRYPQLLEYALAHRPTLVAAALTILRSYVAHGRPDTGGMVLGSFEAWSRLIARAIQFAGGADVHGARVTLTDDAAAETLTLAAVLAHLPRLIPEGTDGLTTSNILGALYPAPTPREPPNGFEELRSAFESVTGARPGIRPDVVKLGQYLKGVRDRPLDGRKLIITGYAQRAARWGVR